MADYKKNLVVSLISYAAQQDVPADGLCRRCGIDLEALRSEGPVAISTQQLNDLFEAAVALTGDRLFGLHFGERLQLAALGIVGTVIRNSRTIGEALENCAAYTPLLTDLFDLTVAAHPGGFVVRLLPFAERLQGFPLLKKHILELSMAFVLHEMDGLLLVKMRPASVQLPCSGEDLREYLRVFRIGEVVDGTDYVLAFPYASLNEPILTADYALQQVLVQRLAASNRQYPDVHSVSRRLVQLMKGNSYLGVPELGEMAANLHMSARTLQRKLREEGVSYQQLAEAVRKKLAMDYLSAGGQSIKQVSFMLGYNDPGAFARAFKKWMGVTPVDYIKSRKDSA
jgi:AraC-like DNA-binding protein